MAVSVLSSMLAIVVIIYLKDLFKRRARKSPVVIRGFND
jgi:hypothetical protein